MFCAFWCVSCCSNLFGLCGCEYCNDGVREVAGVQYSANKWWDVAPLIVMFVGDRVLAYLAMRMGQPR
jgi:hypothetical protein